MEEQNLSDLHFQIDKNIAEDFKQKILARGYRNISEYFREVIRKELSFGELK